MFIDWFRRSGSHPKSKKKNGSSAPQGDTSSAGHTPASDSRKHAEDQSGGFFTNASGSTFNQPHMFDMRNPQFYQTIVNNIMTETVGATVMERLLSHTCPDAAVDSSARDPPPRCHPGTRKKIGAKLEKWLDDPQRQSKMIWLSGSAGTGKSAVAQTFGEFCTNKRRLGAAYFFSRLHQRDDPKSIIPTLAYQLAVRCPEYKSLLIDQITNDFTILQKTPRVQLISLIVEPFSTLQANGHRVALEPLLVVLDGLDECQGINAQCEIVEMIGDVIQSKKDLPILWLICSRPEPHFKYIFSRTDFPIPCDRERLLIDAETRGDVDRVLCDGFKEIRARFWYDTNASWPSETQLKKVQEIVSGLFVLASTILRYVGGPKSIPIQRLDDFLDFMENRSRVGADNPLETLDLLYSRILADVPEGIISKTRKILYFCTYITRASFTTRELCNFLRMDQHEFYDALRSLHSVIDVPSPETAADAPLRVYHASFGDYLKSSFRSSQFFIDQEEAEFECIKFSLFWYKIALDSNPLDGWFDPDDCHLATSSLQWGSPALDEKISRKLVKFSCGCWEYYHLISRDHVQDVLRRIEDIDLRYIRLNAFHSPLLAFLNRSHEVDTQNIFLRTEPSNDLDNVLLKSVALRADGSELYLSPSLPMEPMTFPLEPPLNESAISYCFVGHGLRTCLFWTRGHQKDPSKVIIGRSRLSCRVQPEQKFSPVDDCVLRYATL